MEKIIKSLDKVPVIIVFILVGFLVFSNSLFNNFVIDDYEVLVNNEVVHSIKNIPAFFRGGAFSRGSAELYGQHYRPLMLTTFSFLYTFFGAKPFFYHLVQVLIFILNSYLIFLLLNKFLNKNLSLFLSLIFLIHPINLLAAIFIGSFGDTLFMLFGLLAILFVTTQKELKPAEILAVGLLLFLSLLSKESGILFLPLTVFASYLFQKKSLLKIITVNIILISLYFYLRIVATAPLFPHSFAPIQKATFLEKIFSLPGIFSYYLSHLFVPWNLSMFQHWVIKSFNFLNFVLPLIFVLVFFGVGVFFIQKYKKKENFPVLVFFLIWFLTGIVAILPFAPVDMTVSDRWFSFSFVGLLGMIGIVIQNMKTKNSKILIILATLFLLGFSVRSFVRNFDWKNNLTLAARDVRYSSSSFELQNLYGIEIAKAGKIDEGRVHLEKSVELLPYGGNLNNLASVYLAQKKTDLAIEKFKESAEEYGYYKAYENLASLYLFNREVDFAITETQKFIEKFPTNSKLWQILALAELKKGNTKEAVVSATKYLQLSKSRDALNLLNSIKAGKSYKEILNIK